MLFTMSPNPNKHIIKRYRDGFQWHVSTPPYQTFNISDMTCLHSPIYGLWLAAATY